MTADATSLPVPSATLPHYDVEVWATGRRYCRARIAGVEVAVGVDYTPPAPECGDGARYDGYFDGAAKLVDRADWAKAFPGVEPTCEEMKRLVRMHEDEILERAAAEIADADFDEGDY
jgi:hypothetical protein